MSLLLAQSGPFTMSAQCPLSRGKRSCVNAARKVSVEHKRRGRGKRGAFTSLIARIMLLSVCPCSVGRLVFVDHLALDQCRRPRVEAIDHVAGNATPLHLRDDLLAGAIAHVVYLLDPSLHLQRQAALRSSPTPRAVATRPSQRSPSLLPFPSHRGR